LNFSTLKIEKHVLSKITCDISDCKRYLIEQCQTCGPFIIPDMRVMTIAHKGSEEARSALRAATHINQNKH